MVWHAVRPVNPSSAAVSRSFIDAGVTFMFSWYSNVVGNIRLFWLYRDLCPKTPTPAMRREIVSPGAVACARLETIFGFLLARAAISVLSGYQARGGQTASQIFRRKT